MGRLKSQAVFQALRVSTERRIQFITLYQADEVESIENNFKLVQYSNYLLRFVTLFYVI